MFGTRESHTMYNAMQHHWQRDPRHESRCYIAVFGSDAPQVVCSHHQQAICHPRPPYRLDQVCVSLSVRYKIYIKMTHTLSWNVSLFFFHWKKRRDVLNFNRHLTPDSGECRMEVFRWAIIFSVNGGRLNQGDGLDLTPQKWNIHTVTVFVCLFGEGARARSVVAEASDFKISKSF